MNGPGLRVVAGSRVVPTSVLDADGFQAACVDGFVASWSARGFSPVTIETHSRVLERFLEMLGIPAWEAGPDDVDRVVAVLVARGVAASTRRGYVQAFKEFHRFLVARKAAEIQATFAVTLDVPVDEFNAARHVGNDSPSTLAPPTLARMEEFFGFLRDRIATARKFGPAGRDYALFRTLYHCGLRSDEAASLEQADLHFDRGPFGKIHVRFGKAARGSGPRPRWVPMLDHLDLVLRWFIDDVRPRMADSPALFCDEGYCVTVSCVPGRTRRCNTALGFEIVPDRSSFRAAPGIPPAAEEQFSQQRHVDMGRSAGMTALLLTVHGSAAASVARKPSLSSCSVRLLPMTAPFATTHLRSVRWPTHRSYPERRSFVRPSTLLIMRSVWLSPLTAP